MKYSHTLVSWEINNISKSKNKLASHNDDIDKTQKELFVQEAVRNPDFDQTISEIHERAMAHSTPKERAAMDTVLKKFSIGALEYEDLETVERISGNNYKYLFNFSPESISGSAITTTVLIALVIIGLIALRVAYAFENNSTFLLFISIINVLANAYTFLNWPQQVSSIVEKWLQSNNIKPTTRKKMLQEVSKKLWWLSAVLLVVLIVWLIVCHQCFSRYELGVDIVSIIALGVSILNDHIIQLLAAYFEKHIYYDK